ncbi:MAG: hypothetical protein KDK70_30390 [Myxococcales bacterium]|nr:hypothetical protein [Myxococcales bacterium]
MPPTTTRHLGTLALACGVLVSCPEPESGVGQGPTGGDGGLMASSGTEASGADVDSGFDDTSGAEVPPPPARSYFIAESMDFEGNGCEQTNVNEVTQSLQDDLDDDGWVGARVVDGQTRPADFVDPEVKAFGQDDIKGDAASLAVYAGHGWMDTLAWGTRDATPGVPFDDRCLVEFSGDIRLGAMAGGWAKAVVLLTSCTGRLACYQSTLATSDVTQVFAFDNSPMIWGNAAHRFYRKSADMPSRDAWIAAMDNRPGFGKNSPVTYTRGTSHDQVLELHRTAKLTEIEQIPGQQGTSWYAYTWVDHGLMGDCSPLMDTCVGVDE